MQGPGARAVISMTCVCMHVIHIREHVPVNAPRVNVHSHIACHNVSIWGKCDPRVVVFKLWGQISSLTECDY